MEEIINACIEIMQIKEIRTFNDIETYIDNLFFIRGRVSKKLNMLEQEIRARIIKLEEETSN